MNRKNILLLTTTVALLPQLALAQTSAEPDPVTKNHTAPADLARLKAYQAVREGNRRLLSNEPAVALDAYKHAESLRPDAGEIAFVEGLAHFKLDQLDDARDAFRKAELLADGQLATNAAYSLATCDHAEGLANLDDPKLAISKFEDAMRRYHDVLERQPDHQPAREANQKAASMWRQIKRQMEQQEKQQQQDSDENQEQEESEDQKKQKQDQSDQNNDQESDEQQQQQQDEQDGDKEKEQEQQSKSNEDEQEQKKEQPSEAQQKEQVSREQAQRKLREMMQAQRDRQKKRREQVQRVPVRAVEKDW